MDIFEIQKRCRQVAGEALQRARRRQARLDALQEPAAEPKKPRLSEAEYQARLAEHALSYYAHVSEYEGRPTSLWSLKPKRK